MRYRWRSHPSPALPAPVDQGLDTVEDPVDAEQELFCSWKPDGSLPMPGGPGDPVEPRVCLLVGEFPQERLLGGLLNDYERAA